MQHRFEFELSRDEYVAGLAILTDELRKRDPWRTRVLWEQGVAIFAIILLVMALFPNGVLAVLIVAFFISILEIVMRPRWMRGTRGISYDPAVAEQVVELDSEGLSERSPARLRRWPWASVRQVHDSDYGVMFETAGWDMVMLPARLWANAADRAKFVGEMPCALAARPSGKPKDVPALTFSAMLPIACLAAAVEVLGLLQNIFLPATPLAWTIRSGALPLLVGLVLALIIAGAFCYAVFRIAKWGLIRIHNRSPRAAEFAIQAIILAIPVYFIAAYFRWI